MAFLRGFFIVVVGLAGALWASLGLKAGTALPDHAVLLVNTQTQSYVTVPCVIRGDVDRSYVANVESVIAGTEEVWYEVFVEPMTKKAATALGYRPDSHCANVDGFISWEPWLNNILGSNRRERVAKDGTVLW